MKKYMVYDTESEDIIFYETLEQAEKDYDDHVNDLRDENYIYIFEVVKTNK